MTSSRRNTDRHDLASHVVYVIEEGPFHCAAVIPKGKGALRLQEFTRDEQIDYPKDPEAVVTRIVQRTGGGVGTVRLKNR